MFPMTQAAQMKTRKYSLTQIWWCKSVSTELWEAEAVESQVRTHIGLFRNLVRSGLKKEKKKIMKRAKSAAQCRSFEFNSQSCMRACAHAHAHTQTRTTLAFINLAWWLDSFQKREPALSVL